MRILAVIVIGIVSLLSVGCAVRLQPSQQGEWSNFHDEKDKVSKDAQPPTEKPKSER
jgi:hypothetical protein